MILSKILKKFYSLSITREENEAIDLTNIINSTGEAAETINEAVDESITLVSKVKPLTKSIQTATSSPKVKPPTTAIHAIIIVSKVKPPTKTF